MDLGELIRQERERLGWTRLELSQRSGVSPPAISLLEKGERGGRIDTIAKLASVLGISPERVLDAALSKEDGKQDGTQPMSIPSLFGRLDDALRRIAALEDERRDRDSEPSVWRHAPSPYAA